MPVLPDRNCTTASVPATLIIIKVIQIVNRIIRAYQNTIREFMFIQNPEHLSKKSLRIQAYSPDSKTYIYYVGNAAFILCGIIIIAVKHCLLFKLGVFFDVIIYICLSFCVDSCRYLLQLHQLFWFTDFLLPKCCHYLLLFIGRFV